MWHLPAKVPLRLKILVSAIEYVDSRNKHGQFQWGKGTRLFLAVVVLGSAAAEKKGPVLLKKIRMAFAPHAMVATVVLSMVWTISAGASQTSPPTLSNIAYGNEDRQVMDFWKAEGAGPRPAVLFFHGGGWVRGDKRDIAKMAFQKFLSAGISVIAANYRFTTQAQEAGVHPPVEWPMRDAARALQFVRSKSREWNIDNDRIAATGQSSGACTSLWLAFHDDMADPHSADPVARESTRLHCVAVSWAQTTLDPKLMKEWTPNSRYGGHAFGFSTVRDQKSRDLRSRDQYFPDFLAHREELLPLITAYSPLAHVSQDDSPVFLLYDNPPDLGKPQSDPTHSANFGVKLQEKLREVGVECLLVYPGAPEVRHSTVEDYLVEQLSR